MLKSRLGEVSKPDVDDGDLYGGLVADGELVVQVADQRRLDLANLLQAWKGHVEKIKGDLSLPESDRPLWGVHDFIAALYIRDFLQLGISRLTRDGRESIDDVVIDIDERFRSYTEVDVYGLAERVDGRFDPDRGWWWRRIPNRKPIREELTRYERRR